ncbi:MAG: TIR domain-containing protein [Oscillospiraceae bacterium]|nr:TIR domain-containing protein [Oscillospiraceae bacterium]
MHPYDGDRPYCFISYSHMDLELVEPYLSLLEAQGYRFWFDEGIHPGNEWAEDIAHYLEDASAYIVFLSANAVESVFVRSEISRAIELKKDILCVYLSSCQLTSGMKLQLGIYRAIMAYRYSSPAYAVSRIASFLPDEIRGPVPPAPGHADVNDGRGCRTGADTGALADLPYDRADAPDSAAPSGAPGRRKLRLFLLPLGLILLALLALAIFRQPSPAPVVSPSPAPVVSPSVEPTDQSAVVEVPTPGPLQMSHTTNSALLAYPQAFSYAEASSELSWNGETFSAACAIDGSLDTSWQEAAEGLGEGEVLTLYFSEEVTIQTLRIYPGYLVTKSGFYANARPSALRFAFSDGSSCETELDDAMGPVLLALDRPVSTSYVKITITGVWPGTYSTDTAITEVEAFGVR